MPVLMSDFGLAVGDAAAVFGNLGHATALPRRFRRCGRLYTWHKHALKAAGVELAPGSPASTSGGGLDVSDLVETGRWLDPCMPQPGDTRSRKA
jgi:hypothetical protein